MDTETGLKRIVSEVASRLMRFARDHGWTDGFRIYYHINLDWGGVNLIFVSKHFDPARERENYREVWDFLIAQFAASPGILRPVTVSAWASEQVDRGGLYSIPPGYTELWTMTPLSGPAPPEPVPVGKS